MKRLIGMFAIVGIMMMSGCASVNPMAFNKDTQKIDTTEKSILLMTVDVSRSDGSRYEPYPFVVKTEKPEAESKEDRFNFTLNKDIDMVKEGERNIFLARMALKPGEYKLREVMGSASAFPFIGTFMVPLLADFVVKPGSVTYIGRVTAKLRPRVGEEFRAGSVFPLIDQSVTGLSSGTWDISIDDMAGTDLAHFRENFPALVGVTVEKSILPAYDRAVVQRIWDGNQPAENTKVSKGKGSEKVVESN